MTTAYIVLTAYCTVMVGLGFFTWHAAGKRIRALRDREIRLRRLQAEFEKAAEKEDWF